MSIAAEGLLEAPLPLDEAEPRRAKGRSERRSAEPPLASDRLEALAVENALRFVADEPTFRAIQAHPLLGGASNLKWLRQAREYFDTEFGDLGRFGLALSLRRARGRGRMALEYGGGPGAPFIRGEIDIPCHDVVPRPEMFEEGVRRLVAEAREGRALRPQFRREFRRASRAATFEAARFEIVFAEGEIVAGSAREPFFEIEIVLKEGASAALFRLGLALAEAGLTRLGVESRSARGSRLASATFAPLARAVPPDFAPQASLDEATGALLRNGLTQFLGNWPAMEGPEASEAVHQIRVAMRRLRSSLGLLQAAFAGPEIEALRGQAKAIADAFGDARDWDVFGAMVETGPKAAMPEYQGFSTLSRLAAEQTAEGRAQASRTLAGARCARFVLSLQLFVTTRGWRNAVPDYEVQALAAPAIVFASQALDRSYRRVRKRGRGFETLAADRRHRLRLALKQLRYACDFFGHLYRSPARVRQFAKSAAELQEILGLSNDSEVAAHRVASLDLQADAALGFAAGAVVGWCGRGAQMDGRGLRKAWKSFRRAEPFWRDEEGRATAERDATALQDG